MQVAVCHFVPGACRWSLVGPSWALALVVAGCSAAHGGEPRSQDAPAYAQGDAGHEPSVDAAAPRSGAPAADAAGPGDGGGRVRGADAAIGDVGGPHDSSGPALGSSGAPVECDGCEGPVALLEISAGWDHACALTSDARVVCWGGSIFGELGVGEELYQECVGFNPPLYKCRRRPTLVPALAGVVQVGVGDQHSCALLDDGTVHCWGGNRAGQLGIPDEGLEYCEPPQGLDPGFCSHTPVQVPGVQDAVALAVGSSHNCVLRADGSVACWGSPAGVGAPAGTVPDHCRAEVPCYRRPITQPIDDEVISLHAGGVSSAVLLPGGRALHWSRAPAEPVDIPDIREVHPNDHSCVVTGSAQVLCWGTNQFGQLGYACPGMRCTAPTAVEGFGEVTRLATGPTYTCAVGPAGEITCIGLYPGAYAAVGDYCAPCSEAPCEVCNAPAKIFEPSDVAQLALGSGFLCVLTSDGDFWCSGTNAYGRLGDGLDPASGERPALHCPIGFKDCDSIPHNGCETPVAECGRAQLDAGQGTEPPYL